MTTQLINDSGFVTDDWTGGFCTFGEAANDVCGLHVPADIDPADIPLGADIIRVDFPSFADGRGFTIARMLRARGYQGRLRAHGAVISDQYAMARRVGFDEVEVAQSIADRQPEAEWQFRADWQHNDYQARLRG